MCAVTGAFSSYYNIDNSMKCIGVRGNHICCGKPSRDDRRVIGIYKVEE